MKKILFQALADILKVAAGTILAICGLTSSGCAFVPVF